MTFSKFVFLGALAFWTCKYKGGSGSMYFATDEVREKALNQAYSQCYSSGDTPCSSAGCEKSSLTTEATASLPPYEFEF